MQDFSGVIVERLLLLALHFRDALNEVFVAENGAASAERTHAGFDTDRLQLRTVEFNCGAGKFLKVDVFFINVHLS